MGWEYRRVGAVDPASLASVRWLSGYRHPRYWNEQIAASLVQALVEPRRLADVVADVGDPMAVRPVLFHLLWTAALQVEPGTRLLGNDVLVSVAPVQR